MKKNTLLTVALTVIVASAAIIGGAYALKGAVSPGSSAEAVVMDFYAEWTGYEGNPIVDRIYRESAYVSDRYSQKLDAVIDSFDRGGFDPVLCAQDIPSGIRIANSAVKGDSAVITVEEEFSGGNRMAEAVLKKVNGAWLLDDIICREGESGGGLNSGVSPAIQNAVGGYIRENINEFSPREAVLGGTFHVTSVRFTGPNSCVVDYEDGHIALEARAVFEVPAAGEVKITSFELSDTVGTPDFKHNGNLTEAGDGWQLVYEEPGKPALSARLEFDDRSVCSDARDDSCSPVYWETGRRAEIIGYRQGESVLVRNLRLIGEASKSISNDAAVTDFFGCVAAGNEIMRPDCPGCAAYCDTPDGQRFEEPSASTGGDQSFCEDKCGDGVCNEMVCMAQGCPCAETPSSCPEDCQK